MSVDAVGFLRRMARYLRVMFPVPRHLLFAALTYAAITLFVRRVHGGFTPLISWWSVLGVADVFGTLLVLRLMDELKDRDLDEELFPDRPLPSGVVRETDIRTSLGAAVGCLLLLNAVRWETFAAACVVLGYAFLMFRDFFAKEPRRAGPLRTLATHQPILPLILGLGVVVASTSNGVRLAEVRWGLLGLFLLVLWMPILGWELARKTRAPDQETRDLGSYSKRLGYPRALAAAATAQGVAAAAALALAALLSLSPAYRVAVVASYAYVLSSDVRFARHPTGDPDRLKRAAQLYLLVLTALQVLAFGRVV